MKFKSIVAPVVGLAVALSPIWVGAVSALTTSCAGVPAPTSITWTASSSGGVLPVAYLWGNSSTSSVQTVNALPGIYSMTLQATDASSTVATTTCSATVAQPGPTINTFVATPGAITAGQSSTLSFSVSNASSTSINNGVGTITGTSVVVTPSVTTTYTLSAVSPVSTVTSNVTVTVNATSTGNTTLTKIQDLLNQIANLRAQIAQLVLGQGTTTGSTGTTTPGVGPGSCPSFMRDLTLGAKGDDVKDLQKILAKDPTIFASTSVSGFFGEKTMKALIKYQLKNGIASSTTGFFGAKSRGFMKVHCNDSDDRGHKENQGGNQNNNGNHGEGNKGNGRGGRDD